MKGLFLMLGSSEGCGNLVYGGLGCLEAVGGWCEDLG